MGTPQAGEVRPLSGEGRGPESNCSTHQKHPKPTTRKRKETHTGQMQASAYLSLHMHGWSPGSPAAKGWQIGELGWRPQPPTTKHTHPFYPQVQMKLAPVWEKNFIRGKNII